MNEPMLIFETDPHVGTPKLRALNGAASAWSTRDLGQLEEQLRPRYDGLVREGTGVVEFKGRTLYVRKKAGDTSRQPTLELRTEEPDAAGCPDEALDWGHGFLREIDLLFATSEFSGILPVEKAMLHLVRDELKALLEKTPAANMGLLVLVSILMLAEQLSRIPMRMP